MKIEKCPYCKAETEVERPFGRVVKILFWWFDIPCGWWWSSCSELCDEFMKNKIMIHGKTKREAIKNYNDWARREAKRIAKEDGK